MKSLVVTGASTGIGHATAAAALARGYEVFGSVRTPSGAARLRQEFPKHFTPVLFDVTDSNAVTAAAEQVAAAPAFLPGKSKPRRPNIIWFMPDQWRGQALGSMGDENARTPHLDELARDGLQFRHTIANTPVCCPARTFLMTGQYCHQNGMVANDLRLRENSVTIAKLLRASGYRTGFIGKWHLDGGPRMPGFIPPGFAVWPNCWLRPATSPALPARAGAPENTSSAASATTLPAPPSTPKPARRPTRPCPVMTTPPTSPTSSPSAPLASPSASGSALLSQIAAMRWAAASAPANVPPEELYDITTDPDWLHNLAARNESFPVIRDLRERMEANLREEGDPRFNGNLHFFDTIQYRGPGNHACENWLKNQ